MLYERNTMYFYDNIHIVFRYIFILLNEKAESNFISSCIINFQHFN